MALTGQGPCNSTPGQLSFCYMDTISNILTERGTTHGDFEVNSAISQAIKDVIRSAPNWPRLKAYQKETLDMVAHKIGRTMAGDPNFLDHWVDAGGYVQLTVGLLERVTAPQPEPPQPNPAPPVLADEKGVQP